ncbi:hypothetical protein GGR54DRAFT_529115 [Hypoxylon sp. NC1633]|nr:hypothetical protein GGR54DRAFT_529115 [Hypoxylon sp. NC1633]
MEIVEDDMLPTKALPRRYITRETYLLEEVKHSMVECRSRELPGMFNPMVVGDLFSRQCKPWESITRKLVELIHEAAASNFNEIVTDICDQNTKSRLMKGHIQPALHRLRQNLKDKVNELLEPHLSIHPITYNEYLTNTVQKIQTKRHDRKFDNASEAACGFTSESSHQDTYNVDLIEVLQILKEEFRPNVEKYTASLVADVAAAYYQVALKKFIDDISVNAIEARLIQCLPDVFSSDVVWGLSEEEVESLGSEAKIVSTL